MVSLIFIISTSRMGGGEEWRIYWIQTSQFLPKIKCKSFVSARSPLFFTLYTMLSEHTLSSLKFSALGEVFYHKHRITKKHKHTYTEHKMWKTHTNFFEVYIGGKEVSNIRRESVTDAFLIAHLSLLLLFLPEIVFVVKQLFCRAPKNFCHPSIISYWGLLADVPLERYVLPCITNTKPQTQKHTNTEKQRQKGKNTKCTNTKRHLFNDHEKS